MALEIAVRFRCNRCALAIERLSVGNVTAFPVTATSTIPAPPDGWTVRGTVALCPEHAQLVQPVRLLTPGVG